MTRQLLFVACMALPAFVLSGFAAVSVYQYWAENFSRAADADKALAAALVLIMTTVSFLAGVAVAL